MRLAAIYARISSDDGTAIGVTRQQAECAQLAERKGWTVTATFTDNDVSAYRSKRRPEYERLLAAIEAGDVSAVVVWHPDRLHRRPRDLERFLDLVERTGAEVETVTAGTVDLSTASGRAVARTLVTWAHYESEHKAERISSASRARAEAGRPHGRTAFGWTREPLLDGSGRRVGSHDVVDRESASVVQEITNRVVSGEAVRAITSDLNQRRIASPDGKVWQPVTVRKIALRPRNAGLRVYRGRIIGDAAWPAVVERDLWERAVAVLTDPARRTASSNARRHLLTGLATCGKCGATVRAHAVKGRALYACERGFCVARGRADVDGLVTRVVVGRLAQPDARQLFAPDPDERSAAAADEAHAIRGRLDVAADQFASGAIDGPQLARITARLRPELDALEAIARSRSNSALGDLARPDIAAVWDAVPLSRRRLIIDTLMTVRILPVGKKGPVAFDPDKVEIVWRAPDDAE